MKRLSVLLAALLFAGIILSGCSSLIPGSEAPASPTPTPCDPILHSDRSAEEFLTSYWTDGCGNYLYISPTNGGILSYQTNLPVTACTLYMLSDAVLIGKNLKEDGTTEEIPVLKFEIIDDDQIRVTNLKNGTDTVFVRDSLTVDKGILEDAYVFWSMDRAVPYLAGEWEDSDFNYFTVTGNSATNATFQTSVPYDMDGEYMDFSGGSLCAVKVSEDGVKTFTPVFTFHIVDENHMEVIAAKDGKTYDFERVSAEVDPDNLESDYVFFTSSRAFPFLEGTWKDERKFYFFSVRPENDSYSWETNLPLPEHSSYTIHGGKLVGVDLNEDMTETVISPIYSFRIVNRDEIVLTVLDEEDSKDENKEENKAEEKEAEELTLYRQEEPDPTPTPAATEAPSPAPTETPSAEPAPAGSPAPETSPSP